MVDGEEIAVGETYFDRSRFGGDGKQLVRRSKGSPEQSVLAEHH